MALHVKRVRVVWISAGDLDKPRLPRDLSLVTPLRRQLHDACMRDTASQRYCDMEFDLCQNRETASPVEAESNDVTIDQANTYVADER